MSREDDVCAQERCGKSRGHRIHRAEGRKGEHTFVEPRCDSCRHELHKPGFCMFGYSTNHPDDHCGCVDGKPARAEAPQLNKQGVHDLGVITGVCEKCRTEPCACAEAPQPRKSQQDRCGKCGVTWLDHTKAPSDNHGFVEAAEAPQGETRWGARQSVPRDDLERIDAQVRAGIGPPAQPETGDEARVREIAQRLWLNLLNDGGDKIDFGMIEGAIRIGIQTGRVAALEQCKAADYLTESLRDPETRRIFMEEWKRDNAWLEGEKQGRAAENEEILRETAAILGQEKSDAIKLGLIASMVAARRGSGR